MELPSAENSEQFTLKRLLSCNEKKQLQKPERLMWAPMKEQSFMNGALFLIACVIISLHFYNHTHT